MRKNLMIAAAMALAASSGPSFFGGGPWASTPSGWAGSRPGKKSNKNRDKMAKASRRKNRSKK